MNKLFGIRLTETFITAYKSLRRNLVRTFLTMLGVIIGVFAVVTLVSLVRGVQNYVTDQFDELGSNLLFVSPGRAGITQDPAQAFTNNKLDLKHLELIEKHASEYVVGTSPYITVGRTVNFKTKRYFSIISGVDHDYEEIADIDIIEGRNFTEAEERSDARVAILGPIVKRELFGRREAVGETIKIDNDSYHVIGVMGEKGPEYDEQVFIPFTTLQNRMDVNVFSYFYIKLQDGYDQDYEVKQVELALLKDLKKDDFTLLSQKDLLESVQQILGILSIGLGAVAGISLIVGGIGIMNIMLVSVTERTKEVGLRKALGATPGVIGFQFVVEAVFISVTGGVLGLLLGWGTTFISGQFVRSEIPWWTVILAFGFSFVVGVVFGTYPAIIASKKEPIEALRYE